jgi:hypothetical protein
MELVLYSHVGCCLCERLEEMIQPHLAALRRGGREVELIHRDIADDPAWRAAYGERIPVLLADGLALLEGRPEPAEVSAAFARLGASLR